MLYVSLEPQIIRSIDLAITRETRNFPSENYVYLSIILSLARYPVPSSKLPFTNHAYRLIARWPALEWNTIAWPFVHRSIFCYVHRSIICLSSDTFQFQFDARTYQAIISLSWGYSGAVASHLCSSRARNVSVKRHSRLKTHKCIARSTKPMCKNCLTWKGWSLDETRISRWTHLLLYWHNFHLRDLKPGGLKIMLLAEENSTR